MTYVNPVYRLNNSKRWAAGAGRLGPPEATSEISELRFFLRIRESRIAQSPSAAQLRRAEAKIDWTTPNSQAVTGPGFMTYVNPVYHLNNSNDGRRARAPFGSGPPEATSGIARPSVRRSSASRERKNRLDDAKLRAAPGPRVFDMHESRLSSQQL